MGIVFFFSALTFLGCVLGAAILPITTAGLHMSISGLEVIDGPIFIATLTCALCALGAALVAYMSFCVAFSKRMRGWLVAVLLLLFVGGAVGGSIYGVKFGFNAMEIIDEIERLDKTLDHLDDEDTEAIIRATLSVRGDLDMNLEIEEAKDLALLEALDIDEAIMQSVREAVVFNNQKAVVKVEQYIKSDGTGTRKISIRLPNEDINITQTLPIISLPATPTE